MKICVRFLCIILIATMQFSASAQSEVKIDAKSAILIEFETGEVLLEQNPDEMLPIASVTKVMTMLLAMEALQSGKISIEDEVMTSEFAASMGGSQVFLEPGEKMSLHDILKAVAVASGNDASVALSEHISGSEGAFVNDMNARAGELGMLGSSFKNCNGLDEDGHYSTAHDVATATRELLKHKKILEYTTIWMDSLRNGEFGLSNTNRLIRFYDGALGVKTGSTSKAKFCLSAAAERNGLTLISVVLGADTSDERFNTATRLLDYGFANYAVASAIGQGDAVGVVMVKKGKQPTLDIVAGSDYKKLLPKGEQSQIEQKISLYTDIAAPIIEGQKLGEIIFTINGEEIGKVDAVAKTNVLRLTLFEVYARLLKQWSVGG